MDEIGKMKICQTVLLVYVTFRILDAGSVASGQDVSPQFDFRQRNRGRINSINERINLIQQLIEEEKAAAARAKELAAAQATIEANKLNPESQAIAEDESVQESGDTDKATPNSQRHDSTGILIFSEPVNPLELANSLFLTGNYSAARKQFESQLRNQQQQHTAEEKAWLQCLIGCCFRLESDFEPAETMFRSSTKNQKSAFAFNHSKWSLSYIQQRRKRAEEFESIEQEFDTILKGRTNGN